MTFLVGIKKSDIYGGRVETAKSNATTNIPSKSNFKFHSESECNKSRKPLQGAVLGFFPSLTKLMKLISEDLFGLYNEEKFFSVITISQRTL